MIGLDLAKLLNFKRGLAGGKRTRTADVCLAKAALYQLSYTPVGLCWTRTSVLTLIRGAL